MKKIKNKKNENTSFFRNKKKVRTIILNNSLNFVVYPFTSLAGEIVIEEEMLKSINRSSINKHNPVHIISSTKY